MKKTVFIIYYSLFIVQVLSAQTVGEPKVRKAITQSAQPFNLVDDVYFMRNYFTFFITEKL